MQPLIQLVADLLHRRRIDAARERSDAQTPVVPERQQVRNDAEALLHLTGLGPVGPVEAARPEPFHTAAEAFLRRVGRVPLGLAEAQVVDAAEIGQLFVGKRFLVT